MNRNSESVQPATVATEIRWPKHAVWIGLLVTLVGFLSYFLYFYQFPATRDFPIINLPIVLLGVALTARGCWSVFKNGRRLSGKVLAGLSLLISVAAGGLMSFYVFYLSYQLPAAAESPALETAAPDFTLVDQSGNPTTLSSFRGKKVVVDFYRGSW